MKIIFFGTSNFAAPSLKKILESGHDLLAVVTQPDKKKGRKLVLTPPPIKEEIKDKPIPLLQPKDVSSSDMISKLKSYDADLFAVVDFGQILKKDVLRIPKRFCVNLHASLLPKYRGAAPINWAIIKGERRTGVTTIRMNERMDSGDIILKRECDILDSDTSESLRESLSGTGAQLLLETIELIDKGKARFTKQDEKGASYAHKLKKRDGLIDWSYPATEIHNRIRGLVPWPGAYTRWKGKLLKIWKSSFKEEKVEKKYIASVLALGKDGIAAGTASGALVISELQLEGGKRLGADEFLRGHKLKIGDKFD